MGGRKNTDEFRVSNQTRTSTLGNVKAGVAKKSQGNEAAVAAVTTAAAAAAAAAGCSPYQITPHNKQPALL